MSKEQSGTDQNAVIADRIREAGARALKEATARRKVDTPPSAHREIGGTDGPEPTRYGDWERKGVTSDF
jgi:hypothetical protein